MPNLSQKKIYLIRHGETDFNKNGIVQGSGIDSSLNETGRLQASHFYNHYKNIRFDKIYISYLKRTFQTVEHFIKSDIPYEKHKGLDEICWGDMEGVKIAIDKKAETEKIFHDWKNGNLNSKYKNGESPLDVMVRQKEAVEYILSKENEQTILICMHGRAMRILLSWITKIDLKDMDQFKHENTCLYELTYNGNFQINSFNNTDHLLQLA